MVSVITTITVFAGVIFFEKEKMHRFGKRCSNLFSGDMVKSNALAEEKKTKVGVQLVHSEVRMANAFQNPDFE